MAVFLTACTPAPLPPPATPVVRVAAPPVPTTRPATTGLAAPGAEAALARLNGARTRAGLAPVTLDAELSRLAGLHADYLRLNVPDRRTTKLDPHGQEPGLPGYTAEGAAAARTADVGWRGDLDFAVDSWLGTLYHRLPLLEPRLTALGLAGARGETSPINVMTFRAGGPRATTPVAHPADGEADVPIGFTSSGENPDPVPGGARAGAGYPITLGFPGPVTLVSATLTDAAGAEVACHVSDPAHPATAHTQGQTVCLIAQDALTPGARYGVAVTAELAGARDTWAWTFETAAPRPVADGAALKAANRRLVRVAGTFGALVPGAFVDLPIREMAAVGARVMIQEAAWARFAAAGLPAPAALAGRRFEAVGTVDVDGDDVLVAVVDPKHLTLLP